MYTGRTLTQAESDYVSKAQQRIAQLGGSLAEEIERNDATYEDSQVSVELQYSIDVILYPALDWTAEEIQIMMDFYTLRADLYEFSVCSINRQNIPVFPGSACVTYEMLNTAIENLTVIMLAADAVLDARIDQVEQDSIDRDDALQAQIGSGDAVLQAEIVSAQDVGGISVGDVFVIGTPLEDIWNALLIATPGVSNLSHDNYANPIDANNDLTINFFTWNSIASPQNLLLSDNVGTLTNVPVSGTQYTPPSPLVYSFTPYQTITWTLTGDDITPITMNVSAMYWSYAGIIQAPTDSAIRLILDTDLASAEAEDANTYKQLAFTQDNVEFTLGTGNDWWGWIAVPKVQSGSAYTEWFVDTINSNFIGVNEFITPPQSPDVTFNGIVYSIYRYGYRSPLYEPLKLHR